MRVGIIGCGGIALVHGACYKSIPEAKVVAVADIVKERADKLAKELGAEALYSAEELLKREDIDMVDICLPTYLHCEYAIKAAKAKLHILCEKPIALTVVEGKQMIEAAKEEGVKLMIAQVLRYFPENINAKELIEKGAIGKATMVRTYRGGSHPGRIREWYEDINKSGGAIQDMAIHDIDFLLSCFGPVKEVYARGNALKHERFNEYDIVMLEFENGVIAHLVADWSKPAGAQFTTKMEIVGTEGLLEYDSSKSMPMNIILESQGAGEDKGVAVPESPLYPRSSPYAKEIIDFIEALEKGQEPPIASEEALGALNIALTAMESMKKGCAAKPQEVF